MIWLFVKSWVNSGKVQSESEDSQSQISHIDFLSQNEP